MADQDEYRFTKRRTTNELESDDTATPITKREMMYGWTGVAKTRIGVDSNGYLKVALTDTADDGYAMGVLGLTYA